MENCYFNYENWNAKQTFTKTEVKKVLKQIRNILKRSLNLVILNAVFHQLDIALKCKFVVIGNRHQKKLANSGKEQDQ